MGGDRLRGLRCGSRVILDVVVLVVVVSTVLVVDIVHAELTIGEGVARAEVTVTTEVTVVRARVV